MEREAEGSSEVCPQYAVPIASAVSINPAATARASGRGEERSAAHLGGMQGGESVSSRHTLYSVIVCRVLDKLGEVGGCGGGAKREQQHHGRRTEKQEQLSVCGCGCVWGLD